MKIWMTPAEERAFRGFLLPDTSYLEFGCGGSTVAAATSITGRLASVDSSAEWLAKVHEGLAAQQVTADVTLHHADIGPVGDAGYPADDSRRSEWPRYHGQVWTDEAAEAFDLFMIDGRFRVPCFLQVVLRCRPDAVILFHDYASRPGYHVVARLAREIHREQDLSAFVRRRDFDIGLARSLLEALAYAPG